MWHAAKKEKAKETVLRSKFIVRNTCIRKVKRHQILDAKILNKILAH